MGDILFYEYDIINFLNDTFFALLRRKNYKLSKQKMNIVQHGPFNRFKKSNIKDIYFPITLYSPFQEKINLGLEEKREKSIQNMLDLLSGFQAEGYNVEIPQNWIIA